MSRKKQRYTRHAAKRLRERTGLELSRKEWGEIIHHAKAGRYSEYYASRKSPSGRTLTLLVPFGVDGRLVATVPMVIDVDAGYVVTVLDPL